MTEPTPEIEILRRLVAGSDYTCPVCSYELRGLSSPVCPECGARLSVAVGSDHLRLGPWLTMLLSVAIPLGFFAGFLVITTLMMMLLGRSNTNEREMMAGCFVSGLVFTGLLIVVVRVRRALARRERRRQWLIALLLSPVAWAWLVLVVTWFDW